jgi:hypothetical protein
MKTVETLIPRLRDGTRAGLIQWESALVGAGFTLSIGDATIRIHQWREEGDNSIGYTIAIEKDLFTTVDSVIAGTFHVQHEALADLFNLARRTAYNVSATVGEIEKYLDKIEMKDAFE